VNKWGTVSDFCAKMVKKFTDLGTVHVSQAGKHINWAIHTFVALETVSN
jgi:hypothetical protein